MSSKTQMEARRDSPAFEWTCQRSGRCCSVGGGIVRVEEKEIPGLAAACGMVEEAFRVHHLRQVPYPQSGQMILSLREKPHSGACTLLEGHNTCSVYEARPEHCRTFPYWKGILTDPEALERARGICPGIRLTPSKEQQAAAFAELEELYERVEKWVQSSRVVCLARGVCCHFEEAGHELMATALEADYCAQQHPNAPAAAGPGRCAYQVEGMCTARKGRPLGCRTYFCHAGYSDAFEAGHEEFLAEIRAIERRHGYSSTYGRFVELLAARVSIAPAEDQV